MKYYDFTQTVPDTVWTITHNLNTTDVVTDAFVDQGRVGLHPTKVLPASVVMTDNNTLTVTFSSEQTGTVRVVAG